MSFKIFHVDALEKLGGVTAVYTTKERCVWKFGEEGAKENYEVLADALKVSTNDFTRIYQSHTDRIKVVTKDHKGEMVTREQVSEECDGMITDEAGIMLCTMEADCVPVYIYDPVKNAIGMVHSGWRGTAKEIAVNAIKLMGEKYGSDPGDIVVALGPHICGKCYEVGSELKDEFEENFSNEETDLFFINPHDDKFDLDLGKAIEISLIKAGVKKENFFDSCPCTKESDNLCSWRRDNPIRQSMLTGLMINK